MLKRTPLYDAHLAAGARLVDFGGWQMPLHYGSQIEEHHAVRRGAGVFDVSHMCVVDLDGAGSRALLRLVLSADVDRCAPGQALYACLLNDAGGVFDDLIAYRAEENAPAGAPYRLILNAATAERDLVWLRQQAARAGQRLELRARRDLAILALQGPDSAAMLARARPELASPAAALARMHARHLDGVFLARSGYTGEDGFEIVVDGADANETWERLLRQGVRPCGLGARDTLRLEAGMCLYGQDLDEEATPFESALDWVVDLRSDRPFVGRAALERQLAAGPPRRLWGLVLQERGVLRAHQAVQSAHGEGSITSGTFSPTLQVAIALARLPAAVKPADRVQVQMRGRCAPARVVRPRFVRAGRALV